MLGSTRFRALIGRRSVAKGLTGLAFGSAALSSQRSIGQAPQLSTVASTPPPPREIQTLIDDHINAFNTYNTKLFLGIFGDTAIIIDGIAPYRWLNPNAPAKWLADVEKWRKDFGVSNEHLSYEMGFWNMDGLRCVCSHSRDARRNHQGANRHSDRHPRIHVFKARGGVEDRRTGVGAHGVTTGSSSRNTRP